MRKKFLIGVLGMMAVLLSACSTEKEDMTVPVEIIEPITASADAEPEKQSSVSDESPDTYREIYRQLVTETEGDAIIFSLVYLDNDDTPELVVCDRGYEAYSIYTVKDGKAFCMMEAMTTVEMAYFERSGIVSAFARWNGGGDEGGYGWYYYQVSADKVLVDGDLPTLHFTYDAVYDEEGNWTGGGTTKYYHMDQEIDEAAYQQMMSDLGIIEGNKKVLTDNALGKMEMLDQLTDQGGAGEEREKEGSEDGASEAEEHMDVVKEKEEASKTEIPLSAEDLKAPHGEEFDPVNKAYYSVLERLYKTYTLPDGTELGYNEISDLSENQFAIYDIDQDGREELIVIWTTTYTAGMAEIIYGFDYSSNGVTTELIDFPVQTFYDNGAVEVLLSHNHGLAGNIDDFWPYTFYQYDKGTDTYLLAAGVDAWNRAYYELDYDGTPFPEELDADGDGILYRVTAGGHEKLMDLEEYNKWRDSVIGGAKKMEIPFVKMTEESISGKGSADER